MFPCRATQPPCYLHVIALWVLRFPCWARQRYTLKINMLPPIGVLLYILSNPKPLLQRRVEVVTRSFSQAELRDSTAVNEEFTVPWKVFACSIYSQEKLKTPERCECCGSQPGRLFEKCGKNRPPLYYFGKYKLACSIAFELPPTHLRIAFSRRE